MPVNNSNADYGNAKRFATSPQAGVLTSTTGAGPLLPATEVLQCYGVVIQLINSGALNATLSASMDGTNYVVLGVVNRGGTAPYTLLTAMIAAGMYFAPIGGYNYIKIDQTSGAAATTGFISLISESQSF